MATEITDKGSSLRILTVDGERFILKNQIKEVEIVRDTLIKIDIGQGALYNVFVDQAEVTIPVTQSVQELRDKIMDFLQNAATAGVATEQRQIDGNLELNEVKKDLDLLNDKLFFEPKLVDESNANLIYKGFANPGAKRDAPVWAVLRITNTNGVLSYEWSKGAKTFENIWDNRKALQYS